MKPMPKKLKFESSELMSCGDSGVYGLTVWLGTRNKAIAAKRIKKICEYLYFILMGAAMIIISIYGATRPLPKFCSDHLLGIRNDGKCLSYGDDK